MIRKQLHIEALQQQRLSKLARDLGVSEAEIIRRGIDLTLATPSVNVPVDPSALDRQLEFIKKLKRRRVVGKSKRWTREEIHDRSRR